jgi:hypothetical protein
MQLHTRILPSSQQCQQQFWTIWINFLLVGTNPPDSNQPPAASRQPPAAILIYATQHPTLNDCKLSSSLCCTGEISPSNKLCRTGTVDEALCAISAYFELAGFHEHQK